MSAAWNKTVACVKGQNDMSIQASEQRVRGTREGTRQGGKLSLHIQAIDVVLVILGTIVTIVGIVSILSLVETRNETSLTRDKYEESRAAADDLLEASEYLTTQARMCVVTGDPTYMDEYLNELLVTKRRDHAIATLRRNGAGTNAELKLTNALAKSNELSKIELRAIHLAMLSRGVTDLPEQISTARLSSEDTQLTAEQQRIRAQDMMLGYEYNDIKSEIDSNVDDCTTSLVDDLKSQRSYLVAAEGRLQTTLLAVLLTNMALLVIASVANYLLVMRPMRSLAQNIQENEPLDVRGSVEIRRVAESYNLLYSENHRRTMLLKHQAETDPLTGLLNRGSFDRLLAHRGEDIALLMIDVDLFKQINDTYGHEVGDKILRQVAKTLSKSFRSTDYVCRVGGDEFAVILTEMPLEMRSVVANKLDAIIARLANPTDGLPAVTLSVGIAFSATLPLDTSVYNAADEALYETKRRGRNGYGFYEAD